MGSIAGFLVFIGVFAAIVGLLELATVLHYLAVVQGAQN